ncbi:MAG: type transport system ATP-binding protein, partial [Kribbellaceae bacterium]|nr:type transport system ATP-binding protein [Kribbellaceae bacterium]
MTKAAPRLAVKGLRHLYAERPVIEDLTFTLRAGRAIALVGPNGAGKTTVLKCIVGSAEPAAGQILLDGTPL